MKPDKLTPKQEKFVLNLFSGMNQRVAYLDAGYASNSKLSIVDSQASHLASSHKVLARLEQLKLKAEDASVMSVLERKQKLSSIARAKLTDFVDKKGEASISDTVPNYEAVSEFSVTESQTKDGRTYTRTNLKLHDPQKAIDLLNKMDKLYSEQPTTTINILNIQAKDLSDDELAAIAKNLSTGSGARVIEAKASSSPFN